MRLSIFRVISEAIRVSSMYSLIVPHRPEASERCRSVIFAADRATIEPLEIDYLESIVRLLPSSARGVLHPARLVALSPARLATSRPRDLVTPTIEHRDLDVMTKRP
jgi:hypothetical protein